MLEQQKSALRKKFRFTPTRRLCYENLPFAPPRDRTFVITKRRQWN